jgi:hypothetical protein
VNAAAGFVPAFFFPAISDETVWVRSHSDAYCEAPAGTVADNAAVARFGLGATRVDLSASEVDAVPIPPRCLKERRTQNPRNAKARRKGGL